MKTHWKPSAGLGFVCLALVALGVIVADTGGVEQTVPGDAQRAKAQALMQKGNFRDAEREYRALVLDPKANPRKVGEDLANAVGCLNNLGRTTENDDLRAKAVALHGKNWRLLAAAADSLMQDQHYGFMITGKYERGHHRGGGEYVNSMERDRVQALQWLAQAIPLAQVDDAKIDVAQFFYRTAESFLSHRGYYDAWRLQYLTDLTQLPDFEPGWQVGRNFTGAPVDEQGNPIYHQTVKTFAAAKTDGERWRWCLDQVVENNVNRREEVRLHFANFWRMLYGEETLAQWGWFFSGGDDDDQKDDSGTYALHTLGDDETIARLATGIKRFKLPDEFNFIKIYRELADGSKSSYAEAALNQLVQTAQNRRQYPKAADLMRRAIREYGPGHDNWREQQLAQIVGNWGRFENLTVLPAGKGATVDFRFRNAKKVTFEAHELRVDKLLADVKAYLQSNPTQLDWEKMNLEDLGHRLIQKQQEQYRGPRVAQWELALEPRPNHFDKRINVTTPLQKAGAYLLSATTTDAAGGNPTQCFIVVWLADTAIVKKQLSGQTLYYVADAVSGAPLAKANVEFFGYRQEHLGGNRYSVKVRNFAEFTSADGMATIGQDRQPTQYQWITIARTDQGRMAYLGFDHVWYGNYQDQWFDQTKIFTITDRPVYRPGQTVQFKSWVRRARYDLPNQTEHAQQPVVIEITNPKGEKILTKDYVTDDYGGVDDKLVLPADATLGNYGVAVKLRRDGKTIARGQLSFRVEEYKKPEFEVTIDAPTEPVKLGDKITATIKAKYYFGSPVSEAKVKFNVLRSSHTARWFPRGEWDWFYGSGYWWFASDYVWYPTWREWGCVRPAFAWYGFGWRGHDPPEVVIEREVAIGADGTVKVEIDTAPAKAIHGNTDHSYQITAEVIDQSRRTIVGQGNVLVARKPFKVYTWLHRGYYRTGDTIEANFSAQTLDQKPVAGKGELTLFRVTYDKDQKPQEAVVEKWLLDANEQGQATHKLKAGEPGQYRLSYQLVDNKGNRAEGGYLFTVIGAGFDGANFRYSDLELIPDRREYRPGEKVELMINTNRAGGTVLLFTRPANGIYQPPQVLRMTGKSTVQGLAIETRDMPNFFVEAVTIANGKVHTESREIVVPPEQRVVNVALTPSSVEHKPGAKAQVQIKLTDVAGQPFVGSTVVAMYDKSVEYISGGSNVPEIKSFFWQWRRHHQPQTRHNLERYSGTMSPRNKPGMSGLGMFGETVADELSDEGGKDMLGRNAMREEKPGAMSARTRGLALDAAPAPAAAALAKSAAPMSELADGAAAGGDPGAAPADLVAPSVRTKFADTAYWASHVSADANGLATVNLDMPENLTTWKFKVWSVGHGTKVGQAETELITRKNIIVRLQAPRFFVQKDEVVLSANVHNYLKTPKAVRVELHMGDGPLATTEPLARNVTIDAGGEQRVDWRVKVTREGLAKVRMSASTNEESDAMEQEFPAYVHGMLKTESYAGALRPEDQQGSFALRVPEERRPEQSRIEVRYSPSLAAAMVDALPYLLDYPYGCTEQTLNRFLPAVVTHKVLLDMKLDLKKIQEKRTNLNAQEIGDDAERAKRWKRFDVNPVFDDDEMRKIVRAGVDRLTQMQLTDGGWGWFSGFGEYSSPHTTAVVVHGLQVAKANDVALVPNVLERGVAWLTKYQAEQATMLKNAATKTRPWKDSCDALDALVFMVVTDAGGKNADMLTFLDRDRTKLPVYAKALFGLALHKLGERDKLAVVLENIDQFVVHDAENQTAYLKLPDNNPWWYWYGSEFEAQAYYLKLLAKVDPQGKTAPALVKYVLNNRKHATYWNSTRDTALCVEALADYLRGSGEMAPDMTVEISLDGKPVKTERITAENLFTFDNKFTLEGAAVTSGAHKIEFKKTGRGPLYFNGYVTNFTLEDPIARAGLEIKVNRKFYRLDRVDKTTKVSGSRGQALDRKVEKYERTELANLATLKSGDLVEVELEIESKNDYEYLLFEDMKAAGFEPVEVQSGYGGVKGMSAYMELRDNRVALFARQVARGRHSVAYRLRAEITGKFSALPTRASAMYAPELRGNSDEHKLQIVD